MLPPHQTILFKQLSEGLFPPNKNDDLLSGKGIGMEEYIGKGPEYIGYLVIKI